MKRIIVLASERSGTNLLRVLLGNHKEISAPVAVHFFNTFHTHIDAYGDLSKRENAITLIHHFLRSANHAYTNWELKTSAEDIVDTYNVDSFETAFDAIYKAYATSENKEHYVTKDNDLYYFIPLLERLKSSDDTVHYIYLYRDPRDQVVSWTKTPLFLHTVYDIAKKWNIEQNTVKNHVGKIKMHYVKYEDLTDDIEAVMSKLLAEIELEIDDNCFRTDASNSESMTNELWKNLNKPIIQGNTKKYRQYLSFKQIRMIETICGNNMKRLGYELETEANWKDHFGFYKRCILPFERILNKRKNKRFYNEKMGDLRSKLTLLKQLKNEVKHD